MAQVERIKPDWAGEPCIVAAPGPSLTVEVAQVCRMTRWLKGWRVLAVQDAYRLMPWADALYGCDERWWKHHKDCGGFAGERWSTHEPGANEKLAVADEYGLRLVRGTNGEKFSLDPDVIQYGSNSGFQAINLAILKGCKRIVLVGYDMRTVRGQRHFFGDHPKGLTSQTDFNQFVPRFASAARHLPSDIRIVNATPDSAIDAFKRQTLEVALADDSVLRDGAIDHAAAGASCA